MTFVEAFYSFNLTITNADSGAAGKVRVKTPRHPFESLDHLYARMLAFCHCWHEGISFSRGMFEPTEPAIWNTDSLNRKTSWVEVGCPERKKVEAAMRRARHENVTADFSIYFYQTGQSRLFCESLKGSKTNWISNIRFFGIPAEAIVQLVPLARSSSNWELTIVDDNVYMTADGAEIAFQIERLNMWEQFQTLINNVPA